MSRKWEKQYKLPGQKGMWSAADPRDVPDDAALSIQNAVFRESIGELAKRPGFDLSGLSPVHFDMTKILSAGFYPYEEVEELPGTEELVVNRLGMLIAQVDGVITDEENGLDWWYNTYDFEANSWAGWQGPFTEEDLFGGTGLRADKIRWVRSKDALRGLCGNESDSTPIQVRYVSRLSRDDNGFFHDFTSIIDAAGAVPHTTGDAIQFAGIVQSIDFPPARTRIFNIQSFLTNIGTFKDDAIRYLIVPVYDGHQIGMPEDNWVGESYWAEINIDNNYSSVRITLQCVAVEVQPPHTFNIHRLTGINVYQSLSSMAITGEQSGLTDYSGWGLVKQIDTRIGNPVPSAHYKAIYDSAASLLQIQQPNIPNDIFNHLWVNIKQETDGTDINETYRITDTVQSDPHTTNIGFTPHANTALTDQTWYYIDIEERWRLHVGNTYRIDVLLYGSEVPGKAPPWLPDPNKLSDPGLRLPEVSVNYKYSIVWEHRPVVGNVYDKFAERRFPLQFRLARSPLAEFPGDDILWDFVDVPGAVGDEIMGFGLAYDVLLVHTKYRIYPYVLQDNVPILKEPVFDYGTISGDSIASEDGITRFFGRRGLRESFFRMDGIQKPTDIGRPIMFDIRTALAQEGVEKELVKGWIDKDSNKYRVAINRYG